LKTMLAMQLAKPRPVQQRPLVPVELPVPVPGPGQVLLRVLACGLCHTDLHTIEGELPLPGLPLVPGHQIVGRVEEMGERVDRFAVGQRVGVPWLHQSCGHCRYCLRGDENLCDQGRFTGFHLDGGYAQYALAVADYAYPIPPGFTDCAAAPLLCAGIIGYRSLCRSGIKPGGRLGLYGFGASAHVAIQIARHWDCDVFVFTRSREHRLLARELGAKWTGISDDKPPEKLDGAVIFAPAGRLVADALRVLDKGATVALAGIYMTPIPQLDYMRDLYHERTISSVTASTRRDAEDLLDLAGQIPIRTEVETFPLEKVNEALLALKESRIRGAGVLNIP